MNRSTLLALASLLGISITWWLTRQNAPTQPNQQEDSVREAVVRAALLQDTVLSDGAIFGRLWDPVSYTVLHPVPAGSKLTDVSGVWRWHNQFWLPMLNGGARIHVFDTTGAFSHTIPLGEDGAEYTSIALHAAAGLVSISEPAQQRLRLYDLSGSWQRDIRVSFRFLSAALSPDGDRILFCLAGEGQDEGGIFAAILTDSQGREIRRIMPLEPEALAHPALLTERFQLVPDGVLYCPLLSTELIHICFSGESRLQVDVPIFDEGGWMHLDSVSRMPPSLSQLLALRNALPVEAFIWHPDLLIIGGIWGKVNHDMVLELKSGRHVHVPNGALLTRFGPVFNFGYMRPQFIWDRTFYSIFKAVDYKQILSHIEEPSAIGHLPVLPSDDAWVIMAHTPNREIWFPGDTPHPLAGSGKQMLLRPNPASGRTEVVLDGMTGDGTLEVVDMTGVVRHTEPVGQVEGHQPIALSTAGWPSGTYLVRWIQGDEVTVQKLMVQ